MKKSILNMTINIALSSALLSASLLTTKAYADELMSSDNNNSYINTTETYMLPWLGAGAAAGAVIAGPVGLLVGGIIGAFVGENQQVVDDSDQTLATEATSGITDASVVKTTADGSSDTSLPIIQVAQLNNITPVVESDSTQDNLVKILTTDLSLDVYFRSGSTDVESFYGARLSAIANLINSMDELNIHLDGYTDRRGNKEQNIVLAKQRIDNVRQQLINAGIDDDRIISKAFGEMKMVSSVGDLDAYTFDRKVVIRFQQVSPIFNPEENTDDLVADVTTRF